MHTPARNRILLIIATVLLLSFGSIPTIIAASPAESASAPAMTGDLLTSILPQIESLSSPSWLKEGLRVYYRSSSGKLPKSVSQSVSVLSESPLLKPEDLSLSPFIMRTDITSVSAKKVTSFSTVFVDLLMMPWDDFSEISAGGMGTFWMHPSLLKPNAVKGKGITLTDMPWKILDVNYDAVRLDYFDTTKSGVYYTWIVEKSTGLMLYSARISRPRPDAEIEFTAAEFYHMRYMNTPWASHAVPAFAKPGFRLSYEGNIQTWNQKTGPGLSVPALMQLSLSVVDKRYVQANLNRVYSEDEAYDNRFYIGVAQLGGSFWMPVNYLAGLKEGQVIDRDPITNSVMEVSYIGKGNDNSNRVAIFEFGRNFKRAWIFRSSDGLLVYWMEDKIIDSMTGTSQKSEWFLR